ncbi:MAG: PilZ domain-containing protein [Acidobacteria bacterium]|nr:PilZ domain-containing protein [Acidobacteriota bacterium]
MLDRLHGHVAERDMPLMVRELSLGGMSLETPVALAIGSVHEFRLTLGDGSTVLLRGRVLRSSDVSPDGAAPRFVSGIQFVGDDDDSVGGLIDRLA